MNFPPEVFEIIISFCLQDPKRSPTPLLLTSGAFRAITSRLLYTHLHIRSTRQLHAFLATYELPSPLQTQAPDIVHPPRTIELDLDTDPSTRPFWHIHQLFLRYREQQRADFDRGGRIVLDVLRFRFDTHVRDEGLRMLEEAMGMVSPLKFVWTGPTDIPHHFSIAIVPPVIPYLFRALSGFTRLRELVLTHIAPVNFPSPTVPLPCIPSLEKVYIGQATFVDPARLGNVLASNAYDVHSSKLRQVKLVDVYQESIWGPRLRRSDLEKAAANSIRLSLVNAPTYPHHRAHPTDTLDVETRIQVAQDVIRSIVICQAKTERKYGGDRALEIAHELVYRDSTVYVSETS